MDNPKSFPSPSPGQRSVDQFQATMQNVVRRQWWMWSSGLLVTLLLTVCVGSFAFPGLLSVQEDFYTFNLNLAIRGLVGLVLLFNVYTVYQQMQIQRIQLSLKQQIGAVDRLQDRTEEVYKIAALDSLTGLYNRQSGEQRLAEEISRSQRHSRPLTILMLDLNGLKHINDTFGHAAGDAALKHFAERLQSAIRGSDVAIRLGGDEFLVLLPECKVSELQLVLGRLDGILADFDGKEIPIGFAAGWADYFPGESAKSMMVRADQALYADKEVATEKRRDEVASGSVLSRRQKQVLQLLAEGKSNKEVATALNLSTRTIESYRADIMMRLDIHSSGELVRYAVRKKLIRVD